MVYTVRGMQLLELPDPTGKAPSMWINADHVVSVMPLIRNMGNGFEAQVEVKLEGMPLHRVMLGVHESKDVAEEAFKEFLERLQAS